MKPMPNADHVTRVYQELASLCERQGQPQMRDRFLVLAADAAWTGGKEEAAERIRGLLLQRNPHHLLRPYGSLAEAMGSADVQSYVNALRRSHPYEASEQLLQSLRKGVGEPADDAGAAEAATSVSDEDNWSLDPAALNNTEPLKVFRAPEPMDLSRPRAAPPENLPVTKKSALEKPEERKPKPAVPWQAPPPKPGTGKDTAASHPTGWQIPPTLPAPESKKGALAPPPQPGKQARGQISTRGGAGSRRDVSPLLPDAAGPGSRGYGATDGEDADGGETYWLSWGLFALLLAAGLGLAAYTVGKAFWLVPE
jgi:hypothetical protein